MTRDEITTPGFVKFYVRKRTGGKLRKTVKENTVAVPWQGGNLTKQRTATGFMAKNTGTAAVRGQITT